MLSTWQSNPNRRGVIVPGVFDHPDFPPPALFAPYDISINLDPFTGGVNPDD